MIRGVPTAYFVYKKMAPSLKQLIYRHPEHRAQCDRYSLLDALVAGGSAVDIEVKRKLLINPDKRSPAIIEERLKVAPYYNKIGPIVNRFLAQLFSTPLSFEGSKDKWWEDVFFPNGALLASDSDGRCSFINFLRSAMLQAMTQGRILAQVDTAPTINPANAPQQKASKGDEPYVLLVPRQDLWDWQIDADGYKFAKLHRFSWERERWDSEAIALHDFTIYEREPSGKYLVSRYQARVNFEESKGIDPINLERVEEKKVEIAIVNGLERKEVFNLGDRHLCPLVSIGIPKAFWVADLLYDAQVDSFNQSAALGFGLITSNYAMPTITTSDAEGFTETNKTWGQGYYLMLNPDNKEEAGWLDRPSGAFETSREHIKDIDSAIEKTMQQIAISAAEATAMSSGKLVEQVRAPEAALMAIYAGYAKEFAQGTLNVAAIARGEKVSWQVSGLEDIEAIDVGDTSQDFQLLSSIQIPSQTFVKETQKAFAKKIVKALEISPTNLVKIEKEIDEGQQQPTDEPQAEGEEEQPATGEEEGFSEEDLIEEAISRSD